jgi:hypothetical protein
VGAGNGDAEVIEAGRGGRLRVVGVVGVDRDACWRDRGEAEVG